jgi:hypothetical protein
LLRIALGNEESNRNKSVGIKPLATIWSVQATIFFKVVHEQQRAYAFVSVDKRVILYNEV